jgi:hypothetical protein
VSSSSTQAALGSSLRMQQPGRAVGRGDRAVHAALVLDNADFVGLLALAIYEQHRRDWEENYRDTFGRLPDEHAYRLYELAEHTPRRLAAYRNLAEARLAGSVSPAPVGASESFLTRLYGANRRKRRASRAWKRLAGL